ITIIRFVMPIIICSVRLRMLSWSANLNPTIRYCVLSSLGWQVAMSILDDGRLRLEIHESHYCTFPGRNQSTYNCRRIVGNHGFAGRHTVKGSALGGFPVPAFGSIPDCPYRCWYLTLV